MEMEMGMKIKPIQMKTEIMARKICLIAQVEEIEITENEMGMKN